MSLSNGIFKGFIRTEIRRTSPIYQKTLNHSAKIRRVSKDYKTFPTTKASKGIILAADNDVLLREVTKML